MRSGLYYQYYVEGDDEKKLLEILKRDFRCIKSGKIDKFNVIQNEFSTARIRTLKPDTVIIFVYDTDVDKPETLQKNIPSVNKGPLGFAPQICDSAALLSLGVRPVRLVPVPCRIANLWRKTPSDPKCRILVAGKATE